jgi:hypothetical protein
VRVIDRIETSVRAIDWVEKGEDVHPTERTAQRAVEQQLQIAKRSAAKAIDVCDQLRAIVHRPAYSGMAP